MGELKSHKSSLFVEASTADVEIADSSVKGTGECHVHTYESSEVMDDTGFKASEIGSSD